MTKIHCQACDAVITGNSGVRVCVFPMEVQVLPLNIPSPAFAILCSDQHLCAGCWSRASGQFNLPLVNTKENK